ncbi:serine/threonine-protein phosphatase [Nocardioides marmorisolisilvae]|uniref:Serine/threonine-protein phosphatase n=2 Tax=Nocardioides marmorisolisilvae TaxID=1542737 RepID=A0A3N0DTP1_9ACTN|nr:serine/threonine-protein phosphatase [Nocardioides marmorisolisilvae]
MRAPAPDRPGVEPRSPRRTEQRALDSSDDNRGRNPRRAAALIAAACLVLTATGTWAAARVDHSSEDRLLQVQTRQAAAVLSTAILLIQQPLSTALDAQQVVSRSDQGPAFGQLMAGSVGPDRVFSSASLWHRSGSGLTRMASVGARPALPASSTQAYLAKAFTAKTFTVRSVKKGDRLFVAYALASPTTGYVVYGERALPASRRAPVDKDSAFADVHYAIYFGRTPTAANLSTTDVRPGSLPLDGQTASVTIPFGDSELTLVTQPRRHLGSTLGQRLPLIVLLVGLLLSLVAARSGFQLVRRRQEAEADTATITGLYERVDSLYGEQRDLFVRLQRALLPHVNPDVPNLEIASRYVAGTQGIDIGGDWYSIIGLDEDQFAFVVGDVSGRGVDAVAVMAHARFTARAYLLDGDPPAVALEKCSRQFDISTDGHITTALVGIGNARTGEMTVASAGHPTPLLISPGAREFVQVKPGLPLGAGAATYHSTRFTMTPGSTLFCFTDGLVERRGEGIDTGLQRLADTMTPVSGSPVEEMVDHALQKLRSPNASDDIAILAIRWEPER